MSAMCPQGLPAYPRMLGGRIDDEYADSITFNYRIADAFYAAKMEQ